MIQIKKTEVKGFMEAIRGMRNPLNSWIKSDTTISDFTNDGKEGVVLGQNDLKLMKQLKKAGTDHRKYLRMITVYVDITAPLYWWKEFDTYKVGTVANSCSTMHKIQAKEFTLDDFSHEHLISNELKLPDDVAILGYTPKDILELWIIPSLNLYRHLYNQTKEKRYWWQMIQLLPSSYNQKRTVLLNYEVLSNIYHSRKNHKLDEWHVFCAWIEKLPYAQELIMDEQKEPQCDHLQKPLIFVENLKDKGQSKWRCPNCDKIILRNYLEKEEPNENN